MPWKKVLKAFDAAERHNNKVRGVSFSDSRAATVDLVRGYLYFARYGTLKDITGAVSRDERGIRRALGTLTTSGEVLYSETPTRGVNGSFRKTYYFTGGGAWSDLPDEDGGYYFNEDRCRWEQGTSHDDD